MLLSKEQILAADDLATEDVDCPEWGGTVRLRALSAAERDDWDEQQAVVENGRPKANTVNIRARFVALCAVDETGSRLFTEADVEALGRKSAPPLDRLFWAAMRLSKMAPGDLEAEKGN